MVSRSTVLGALADPVAPATAGAACEADKPGNQLTGAEARAVSDGIAAELAEGYRTGPKRWIPEGAVAGSRDWVPASKIPAAPGFHGGRFLPIWVSEVGAEAYMAYAETPGIPVGTFIAKESFTVNDAGEVTHGPLFLMRKVEEGTSPEALDWHCMAVAPGGSPEAIDLMTACIWCLGRTFERQGGLGHPVEEARVGRSA